MNYRYFSPIGAILLMSTVVTQAQSLSSGFMSGRKHGSVSISGTQEWYESVYLVPEKVDQVPIFRRINVRSVSLYANYGITDKIEAVLSLPYVRSEGNADPLVTQNSPYTNVREGLQDVSGLLKFKVYSTELGSSLLNLLGVASLSTPVSNYKSEQGLEYIIAIGNRATKVSTLGIAQLQTASGVFFTGQAGYSLRSGRVPNAFVAETKVGYAGPRFYVDGWAAFQQSASTGTDILQPGFDGDFTATRVDYTRLGVSVFRPLAQGFGLVLGASTYVSGRNVGKSTGVTGGLAYNF
ncbi:hypothetical protein [Hymenobacter metallilatus]|uniref:Transporter n=1 Tax=Hymenobacter metallilatus TaxID=2493666 RepID=A0A3R9UKH6_9BACT|nr:hypothetical protein [Hymenobacter metallilatus]RSK33833.1 hypothetical protein EI290_08975 [Hymenobacter metallilatus]